MPVFSVTRLHVRSWRYFPMFFVQALRSARQAAHAEGNLAARILRDDNNAFWTQTIWDTQDSMRAFMISGVHGGVMRKLLKWCDEAALVHWTQESETLPTWHGSFERLQKDGRRSKVRFPSAAHESYSFPPPHDARRGELRLR